MDLYKKQMRTIDDQQLNITALNEFSRTTTNLININIRHTVRVQLDQLHNVVYPIYTKLFNETEQKAVQVLIIGPKTSRKDFPAKQYFQKLLGGKNLEGKRLLYAENTADVQRALNILRTWLLDAHAARVFFNNETRLQQDFLMDEASIYMGMTSPTGEPINIFFIVRIKYTVVRANPKLSVVLSHMTRTTPCFIRTIVEKSY
ncbi:unnamed protein product [Rotaria sp. Silwood2]|nr:unnamed protein product [Rotaria sp. Silwood2]